MAKAATNLVSVSIDQCANDVDGGRMHVIKYTIAVSTQINDSAVGEARFKRLRAKLNVKFFIIGVRPCKNFLQPPAKRRHAHIHRL